MTSESTGKDWIGCHMPQGVVIEGDFNFSIGDTSRREWDETAGSFELGRTNEAGYNLMNWYRQNNLQRANSF